MTTKETSITNNKKMVHELANEIVHEMDEFVTHKALMTWSISSVVGLLTIIFGVFVYMLSMHEDGLHKGVVPRDEFNSTIESIEKQNDNILFELREIKHDISELKYSRLDSRNVNQGK